MTRTVHCFQHSERVRPLGVSRWAAARGVDLRVVRVDEEPLPDAADIDRLVVLGGEMNTDEAHLHPWLDTERAVLRELLRRDDARIFGICLGSQLLAEVLGGTVGRAVHREVGWHRVRLTDDGRASRVFGALDAEFEAMEWHGDESTVPPGARLTLTGDTCGTQGFEWEDRVWAVQFHPEFTHERTSELAASTTDDLSVGGAVQTAERFLADPQRFSASERVLDTLLHRALLD